MFRTFFLCCLLSLGLPTNSDKGAPDEIFFDDFEGGSTATWNQTEPPVSLVLVAPASGSSLGDPRPTIRVGYGTPTGIAVDPQTLTFDADGLPLSVTCSSDANQAECLPDEPFADGPVTLAAAVADVEGNLSPAQVVTFTVDTISPDALDLSRLTVTFDAGFLSILGAIGSVESNARVRITNQRTGEVFDVQADAVGAFSASIAGQERDILTFEVIDLAENISDAVSIPAPFDIPPDPSDVAPPLDPTVATQMGEALEFLWTGDDPIQQNVEPGVIEPRRIGWIRGRVVDRDGLPVPGVTVRCLGHDELGWTRTRMDGLFDFVVNGGGTVVLDLERSD